jgi:hypothetical protein
VVVAGGPIALFLYLLYCHRHGIVGCERKADGEAERARQTSDMIALVFTASFKPQYWWYSVVILLRRLVLIVMLTFIQRGVYSWLTIANHCFLTLHLLLWPYVHARDSVLELVTALALSTQTAVISAYPAVQSRPSWVSGLLWLLFLMPLAAGATMALWRRCCHLVQGGRCCRCLYREPESEESPAQQKLMSDAVDDL